MDDKLCSNCDIKDFCDCYKAFRKAEIKANKECSSNQVKAFLDKHKIMYIPSKIENVVIINNNIYLSLIKDYTKKMKVRFTGNRNWQLMKQSDLLETLGIKKK
jgi:hypothetical protein